jgi:hypothetical protein
VHRLPEMVNTWLAPAAGPTMAGPRRPATPFVCRASQVGSNRVVEAGSAPRRIPESAARWRRRDARGDAPV